MLLEATGVPLGWLVALTAAFPTPIAPGRCAFEELLGQPNLIAMNVCLNCALCKTSKSDH